MSRLDEIEFTDEAIDRGVRAWFSVRQVPVGRPILRDRMRAAVATVLAASPQSVDRMSTRPSPSRTRNGARSAQEPRS